MLRVHVLPKKLKGKVCVLIDVLRATSTITTLLARGAKSVKPVRTLKEARLLKKEGYLIAGERGGLKPRGFDFGNSPVLFSNMDLEGEKVALTTTNGTRALSMLNCETIYAASFLNLSSIIEVLKEFDEVDLICSGTKGEFSLEDFLLAGFISKELELERNDSSLVASRYASSIKDVKDEILKSKHAGKLIKLGFEKDVDFCSRIDVYSVVPVLENGEFIGKW